MNKFLSACLIAALSGCSDYVPTLQNYDPVTQGYKKEGDFLIKEKMNYEGFWRIKKLGCLLEHLIHHILNT